LKSAWNSQSVFSGFVSLMCILQQAPCYNITFCTHNLRPILHVSNSTPSFSFCLDAICLATLGRLSAQCVYRILDLSQVSTYRGEPAILLIDALSDCRYHIEASMPDASPVAYATSLGITESGGNSRGI
jgi:hypothetical protein